MKQLDYARRYFRYLLKSKTKYDVHSPFVFECLTQVLENKKKAKECGVIERLRRDLKSDTHQIMVQDYGAGAVESGKTQYPRRICDMVRTAAKSPAHARLLYRLSQRYGGSQLLELGTSLGISSMYLAAACPEGQVTTLEGCPETAARARTHFKKAGFLNIQCTSGPFETTLAPTLKALKQLDFVFFDGNHRFAPTVQYFEQCLPYAGNDTLFVFDDIHWSEEMEKAWDHVRSHPRVTLSIDLFQLGLLFFRKENTPQHFILRY